jgi:hypothetical protein
MDFSGERQRILGLLAAAAIVASDNPAATPPCVAVGLPTADIQTDQHVLVRTPVYVAVPGPAGADAVRDMLASLGAVTTALGDPQAVPGLAGFDAAGASGYTVTTYRRVARALCP